ncbi:MAG: hypothetical protein ACOC0H_07900 [Thermodesulfobacteriota bacterium]
MKKPDLRLIESTPLRFLVSTPKGDSPENGWPLLCFLHGYDEAAPLDIFEGLTRHGPFRWTSSRKARDLFILVAPQLHTAGDVWFKYGDIVKETVMEIRAQERGDSRCTYLTGFSFGGNGVFDLALMHADFWSALWPVDPTRVPKTDPERPVWLSFGEVSRTQKAAFIQKLDLIPADTPMEGDHIYLDQGHDHVGSAKFAYQDDRIYDWLLLKKSRSV